MFSILSLQKHVKHSSYFYSIFNGFRKLTALLYKWLIRGWNKDVNKSSQNLRLGLSPSKNDLSFFWTELLLDQKI